MKTEIQIWGEDVACIDVHRNDEQIVIRFQLRDDAGDVHLILDQQALRLLKKGLCDNDGN